jgi:5-oxoprolinase (ATP-hydrolysing) subunit A
LSNIAAEDEVIAEAVARAIRAVDKNLAFLVPAATKLEQAGLAQELTIAHEIFADRAYTDAGLLADRSSPGAVLDDAEEAAGRVAAMISEGAIITISGKRLKTRIDSICVHGDTPNAVAMARAVRVRLEQTGVAIAPFVRG